MGEAGPRGGCLKKDGGGGAGTPYELWTDNFTANLTSIKKGGIKYNVSNTIAKDIE